MIIIFFTHLFMNLYLLILYNFVYSDMCFCRTPSSSARDLGVTMDDKHTLTAHITAVSRSYRFTLYNIQKIKRYLSEHSTQLLVQALVCNSLLAGLPACATHPLQRIQNAAARLIFNLIFNCIQSLVRPYTPHPAPTVFF